VIKAGGASKHHDQIFADLDGDGRADLPRVLLHENHAITGHAKR
jgi:hypothetical protein